MCEPYMGGIGKTRTQRMDRNAIFLSGQIILNWLLFQNYLYFLLNLLWNPNKKKLLVVSEQF